MKGFSKWFGIVLAALLFAIMGCTVSSGDGSSHDLATVTPVSTSVKKYSITIADGITNGTVTADKQTAAEGEKVTLSISPSANFVLKSISVTDIENNPVSVTENGKTGSFTVPASNIIVSAKFITFVGTEYKKTNTQTIGGKEYDLVLFGDFPQSLKKRNVTVYENRHIPMGEFSYCLGSDDHWYVKIFENARKDTYTYSDGSVVGQNGTSEKWFRVDPIEWRVLTNNYNESGTKLLLSQKILTGCSYYDYKDVERTVSNKTIFPNNYFYSKINYYLNGYGGYPKKASNAAEQEGSNEFFSKGFIQTAFTNANRSLIKNTNLINNARSTNPDEKPNKWNDGANIYASNADYTCKIFILSEQEVTKADYGFDKNEENRALSSQRVRTTTDFGLANGVWIASESDGGFWWLRSPSYSDANQAYRVRSASSTSSLINISVLTNMGIVPALCVQN